MISIQYCRVKDILTAYGVVIPVTVANDTQRRHVQKQALMVNLMLTSFVQNLAETIEKKNQQILI
jgi:hypothetical protein